MRTALVIAIALVAAGCKKAPDAGTTAPPGTLDWSQASPDGKYELTQKRDASGCRTQLANRESGKPLWTSQNCLPAPSGLVFVSPGADQLLALDLFPASATAGSEDWSKVVVASLWTRGTVSRQYTGAEILAADRVKAMGTVLSWLKGESYDELKTSARAVSGGAQVSIDLVDGRTILLGFEGTSPPKPPVVSPRPVGAVQTAEPPAARAGPAAAPRLAEEATVQIKTEVPVAIENDDRMYRWEDERRSIHFGLGSQVPAKYRKRAALVEGRIDVVSRPAPGTGTPAQPPAGSPPQGQPAPGGAPAAPPPSAGAPPPREPPVAQ